MSENIGVLLEADPGPGILHKLTGVIAQHGANITSVDIIEERKTYFEIDVTDEAAAMIEDLSSSTSSSRRKDFAQIGRQKSAYARPLSLADRETNRSWIGASGNNPLVRVTAFARLCRLPRQVSDLNRHSGHRVISGRSTIRA